LHDCTGTITALDAAKGSVTVKNNKDVEKTLLFTAQAKITSADKAVTLADLKVGEKVKVNFTEDAGKLTATKIITVPVEKAKAPATRRKKRSNPTQTTQTGNPGNGFPVLLFSTICYTDRAL